MRQKRSLSISFTNHLVILLTFILCPLVGNFLEGKNRAYADTQYEILVNHISNNGYIFLVPSGLADNPAVPHTRDALGSADERKVEIRKPDGTLIAHYDIPAGQEAGNFQLQKYRGRSVFTWWQGKNQYGHGLGDYYISDSHFHILKRISLSPAQGGDLHEFRFLDDHTAAVSGYHIVTAATTHRRILEGVFSIVNLDSDAVIFTWHSLAHVALGESFIPVPHDIQQPYDYFHINSIALAPDKNYLISSRNTSTLYKINSHNGTILWKLGGKHSTFALGAGTDFSYQHDAQFVNPQVIRLFDNTNSDTHTQNPSSVLWLQLDEFTHHVTLLKRWKYPHPLVVWAMGNAQGLSDGGVFGSWGTSGHIGEFNAQGELVYDAYLPHATTYRAFFYPSLD